MIMGIIGSMRLQLGCNRSFTVLKTKRFSEAAQTRSFKAVTQFVFEAASPQHSMSPIHISHLQDRTLALRFCFSFGTATEETSVGRVPVKSISEGILLASSPASTRAEPRHPLEYRAHTLVWCSISSKQMPSGPTPQHDPQVMQRKTEIETIEYNMPLAQALPRTSFMPSNDSNKNPNYKK